MYAERPEEKTDNHLPLDAFRGIMHHLSGAYCEPKLSLETTISTWYEYFKGFEEYFVKNAAVRYVICNNSPPSISSLLEYIDTDYIPGHPEKAVRIQKMPENNEKEKETGGKS